MEANHVHHWHGKDKIKGTEGLFFNPSAPFYFFLKQSLKEPDDEFIRHASTGRPLGSETFIQKAEKLLNRSLQKKKPGPKVGGNN